MTFLLPSVMITVMFFVVVAIDVERRDGWRVCVAGVGGGLVNSCLVEVVPQRCLDRVRTRDLRNILVGCHGHRAVQAQPNVIYVI